MNRKGNSILAGTLFLSMLLSPVMRGPASSATPAASENVQTDTGGGKEHRKADEQSGDELTPHDRDSIERNAAAQYDYDVDRLIQDECRHGERLPEPQTVDSAATVPACRLDLSNFIVAIVPDPVHTHQALSFDRGIDTIEEALQDEHYQFVYSKMPWDAKSHPESDEHNERDASQWEQDAREDSPGLMVFRADPSQVDKEVDVYYPSPLLVFVVGETPTGGVHKEQFQNALGKMELLIRQSNSAFDLTDEKTWQPPNGPGLRILGPMFSGSLASLAELLECNSGAVDDHPQVVIAGCYPRVSIHSGTITSRDAIDQFNHESDALDLHANFVSFQESDSVAIERFVEFLTGTCYGKREYDARRIALLSEDETAYGNVPQHFLPDREGGKSSNCLGSNVAQLSAQAPPPGEVKANLANSEGPEPVSEKPSAYGKVLEWMIHPYNAIIGLHDNDHDESCGASASTAAQNSSCMLLLHFPREISQLRAAYQKDIANNDGRDIPRDILPSSSDVPGSDDDTVPEYSERQLPLSQESIMLGVVSELRKHRAQFIVVRATDPMDTLFLIRYLRTAYPQGRVVTLGADMLFRREAEDPRFHGLLSLATYSLAPAADHGFVDYENSHAERVFPSTLEVGTFNATRSLLFSWVDDAKLPGQRHLLHPEVANHKLYLCQYGWRQQRSKYGQAGFDAPPVRLLALGRDQYWPIASLGPYLGEQLQTLLARAPAQLIAQPEPVAIPTSWRAVQLLAFALALFFCWRLWHSSIFSPLEPVAKFAPAVHDRRLWLIVVYGFALIFILLILIWPAMHGAEGTGFSLEPILFGTIFLVLGTTLLETSTRSFAGYQWGSASKWTAFRRKPIIPVVVFLVPFLILMIGMGVGEDPRENSALIRAYSMLRSTQLTSGLSFLMPSLFFLTVWLWWAEQLFASDALLDDRRPRLPDGMTKSWVALLSPANMPELCVPLSSGSQHFRRYLVVFVALLGCFAFLMGLHHPVMSLEKRVPVEWAMTGLFLLALGGIVAATRLLWDTWIPIRKLLVNLDSVPLRNAFKSIEGFSWKPIWRFGTGSLPEFIRVTARKREALQCATNTLPELRNCALEAKWNAVHELAKQAKSAAPKPLGGSFTSRFKYWKQYWTGLGLKKGVEVWFKGWLKARSRERQIIYAFGEYQQMAARVAGEALNLLSDYWDRREERPAAVAVAVAASQSAAGSVMRPQQQSDEELMRKVRACESFVCMSYVTFLLVMLVRIRSLIVAIGGMYVLTLIGITQYPFEPKGALQLLLVALLVFVVSVVGVVFAQIHRDSTLSNLTGTNPGELGIDFYIKMGSFVALPLVSLLASQFPSINRFFYSWLQPAVEALNR